MLFLISLDLGSIILPLVIFQTLTHFCVAGLKVMMVMGMVVVKMISFVFFPITGSSRSSTQPYGKSGRMEGTTTFLWERLRLQ